MLKIKIKETNDSITSSLKYRDISSLESIVLLDMSISILRKDFQLSDEEIWEMLKEYRNSLKEVD